MITISNEDALRQSEALATKFVSGAVKPLFSRDYLKKTLTFLHEKEGIKYPREIRVAKDIKYLLRGDFEPKQIVRLTEPLMKDDIPIWFGDSAKGIRLLGLGFQDGDSLKPSRITLGDADIHAILAGATGQGKSVTLEAIIDGVIHLYAPWSARLTMLDAKISSFKKYGTDKRIPHISSIGATEDVDFIISVLGKLRADMLSLNSVFAKSGKGDKISDFIKATGLTIPQNFIIVDEFQTLLKFAGKKTNMLLSILDDFARLGRNTGYHLLLSSQEFPSDVPDAMLNQIKVRLALGCSGKVSTKVLGNAEGKMYIGKKGRLIANLNPEEGDTNKNMHFRVPFNPSDQNLAQMEFFEEMGKKVRFAYDMDFYDEKTLETFPELRENMRKIVKSPSLIFLSEPSFAMEPVNGVKRVPMYHDGFDKDSTMAVAQSSQGLMRIMEILACNYEGMPGVGHNWFSGDGMLEKLVAEAEHFPEIDWVKLPVSGVEDQNYLVIFESYYFRKLLVDTDELLQVSGSYDSGIMTLYGDVYAKVLEMFPEASSQLNSFRFATYCVKLATKEFQYFGLSGVGKMDTNSLLSVVGSLFQLLQRYGKLGEPIKKENLTLVCEWITGLDRIVGLGRIPSGKEIDKLRDVLLDAYKYNLRFYLFTKDVSEIKPLALGCRFGIFDPPVSGQVQSAFKCQDFFPAQVPDYALVFYDSLEQKENERVKKCKKVIFEEEFF